MSLFFNNLGRRLTFRGNLELARFNPDVLASNLKRVRLDSDRLIHDQLAGGHIVLPAVPRTGNGYSVEFTLTQGASPMQTGVIYRVELASYVSDSNGQAVYLKLANRARRNLIFSRCTHKTHLPTPS